LDSAAFVVLLIGLRLLYCRQTPTATTYKELGLHKVSLLSNKSVIGLIRLLKNVLVKSY